MRPLLILYLLSAIVIAGCSRSNDYRQTSGAAWGTSYHIVFDGEADLADSVVAEMRRVEMSLSMFDSLSTVSGLNARTTDVPDAMVASLLKLCGHVNRASGGRFDPTVAPLTDLWGFGRKGRDVAAPDSAEVAAALANVGFNRINLSDGHLVMPTGMELDFSAVAKGYGVDCVAAMLARNGCKNYMVEIGGEVSVSGHNPAGKPWRIQIDSPMSSLPGQDALGVVELTDCGIATSGNYRNFRELGADSVIGHTINPLTGYPERRSVVSSTVIAPTCAMADALATACMLLDTAATRRMIAAFPSVRALICLQDGTLVSIP